MESIWDRKEVRGPWGADLKRLSRHKQLDQPSSEGVSSQGGPQQCEVVQSLLQMVLRTTPAFFPDRIWLGPLFSHS